MMAHATYSLFFSLSLSLQPLFLGDSRTLEVEMFLNLWTKSKILNQFEADQNPLFYFSGMYTCKWTYNEEQKCGETSQKWPLFA